MIPIDEALRSYDDRVAPLPEVELPLEEALGRVLAQGEASATDLPPFRQSAMDGYALRAEDTRGATPDAPARLELAGVRPAGPVEDPPGLGPGEAVRIFTGGHLPEGADAVLRQEEAAVEDGELRVAATVDPGTAVRERGEELREGAPLAPAGARLSAGHLGALAVTGVDRVRVRRAPRVRLLTTGDEVVGRGRPLEPGQVYDANTPLVLGWLREQRADVAGAHHVADDPEATREALSEALAGADLVLTTGGVSVGDRDYVLEAAEGAGVERVFWRVRQKPGKPLFFGVSEDGLLLGLPGNPGSVHACLVTHVRRVLDLLEGVAEPGPRMRPGRLGADFPLNAAREWWVRCEVELRGDGEVWLEPLERQASHMIGDLGRAEALARLPRGEGEVERGTTVPWTPAAGAFGVG